MYINVWNCRASIIVETNLGAIDITHVIRNGRERAEKHVNKIGAINISGQYPLSKALINSIDQPKVEEYIEQQYEVLRQQDIEKKIDKWREYARLISSALSSEYKDIRLAIAKEIKNNKKLNELFDFLQKEAQDKAFILPDEKNITLTQWVDRILKRHNPSDLPEQLFPLIKEWEERPRVVCAKIKDHENNIIWFKNFFNKHPEFGWITEGEGFNEEYFNVEYLPTAEQYNRWGLFLKNQEGFKYPLLQTVLPHSAY